MTQWPRSLLLESINWSWIHRILPLILLNEKYPVSIWRLLTSSPVKVCEGVDVEFGGVVSELEVQPNCLDREEEEERETATRSEEGEAVGYKGSITTQTLVLIWIAEDDAVSTVIGSHKTRSFYGVTSLQHPGIHGLSKATWTWGTFHAKSILNLYVHFILHILYIYNYNY